MSDRWCWIAVDPGDVHTGWAMIQQGESAATVWEGRGDRTAEDLDGILTRLKRLGRKVTVILEAFVLYADKAKDQVGSPMLTSQNIGAAKEVCRKHDIGWVEQGAGIKKVIRAQLRGRGVKRAKTKSVHAKDAELHLYNYLVKRGWDGKSPLEPKGS